MNKILIYLILSILFITSCVKEEFDERPQYQVDYDANTSIAELISMYEGSNLLIDTNIIVKGIVTADDKSGNFYKELFFQDTSAAISIRLEDSYISDKFPIGRQIYVKMEGLYLGDYQDVMQIGWGPDVDRIPANYTRQFNVPDVSINESTIEAKLMTIDQFNDSDLGKLIKLENVQFLESEFGNTYADAINQIDKSRTIEDCKGNQVIIRNSGFADFASDTIPEGNGSLIAILSKFGGNYQLKIRSTDEVLFTGDRCSK
jgi:uncharacterized protein YdeI (BOF family)